MGLNAFAFCAFPDLTMLSALNGIFPFKKDTSYQNYWGKVTVVPYQHVQTAWDTVGS